MKDLIERQAAIDALRYAQHRFTVADEAGGIGTVKWIEDVIYFAAAENVLNDLPSAQPNLQQTCNQLATDTISRQAVAYLDLFTKTYCRDYSVTDDLVFRCKECEFEMPDGKCLVKCMARKLCPDYKDFGSMGNL